MLESLRSVRLSLWCETRNKLISFKERRASPRA